ncbi:MAG: right-handed parallel beta-helix repeat-containing protein [Treponema sp.]|nr:right-handed parallel beta-helix repeat-containing protein [Treponema sp.]
MTKTKKSISLRQKAIFIPLMLVAAILCSCTDTLPEKEQESVTEGGGYEQFENSEGGTLTVSARVSNGSPRHAMPSIPELVYAALLYKDGAAPANPESKDFVQGTATEDGKLIFSFQRPDDTSGKFTLEIFAFKTDTSATVFSRATALLSGKKVGCKIEGDKINVSEPIALSVNSSSEVKGTVSLKIKVPEGCSLEIDDARFSVTGTSPDFTVTQAGDGISAGAYQVTFTVKKGDEIVHIFSEYINVFPGMRTDTWSGLEKDAAKEITQSMISSTVYVRGEGGWYDGSDYKNTATASDTNLGSFLSPFASIQKAVDTVIARNDGASEYTIYIDGKFTAASSAALADFSGVSKHLSVRIAGLDPSSLDESKKAVIDGNGSARGIVVGSNGVKKDVNLALENLVIQNTKNSDRGGGITLYCTASNSHTIKNCVIKNNHAGYGSAIYNEYGSLDLQGCVISGNTADTSGTVYIGRESAILTMSDVRIENNSAGNGGGIFLGNDATVKISDASVVIKNNSASGGNSRGPGISLWNGYLELSGSAKIEDVVGAYGDNSAYAHEIVISGDLTATSPVATITPSDYTADRQVLSAGGSITDITQDICDKFAITPQADGMEWKIVPDGANGVLKAVINVYVRGSGEGWYTDNGHGDITGSDDNSGDRLHPFATIQKAVAAVKNLNDGETECTIYVDGTVTQETSSSSAMVYLYSLDKNLTLTIKSLSETKRATLDANNLTTAVEVLRSNIDLAIENLILCNGKDSDYGLYLSGLDVTATFVLSGCEISGNRKGGISIKYVGTFAIENCEIIDNNDGGGVYISSYSSGMISGSKIKNNTSSNYGGLYIERSNITIKDCEISDNISTDNSSQGGGIRLNGVSGGSGCSLIMEDCVVSGNSANEGGGIYLSSGFSLTMKGSKSKISENVTTGTSSDGGGVHFNGTFTMEDGEISGNNATRYGGGVYVGNGTFIMNGGKITGNTATEKGGGVYEKSSDTFTKNGGEISGNSPDDVYP